MEKQLRNQLDDKLERLEAVQNQLKEEFIGLDKIIDQLCSSVSSWYLFPDLQIRPMIINLWGMTGVGKTSLVNRLIELLDFEEIHYRFDLGELKGKKLNVSNQLEDLRHAKDDRPTVITFDEFQLARTIDEKGSEIIESENRIIWKLLDSGVFEIDIANSSILYRIARTIKDLEFHISKGIRAQDGIVTEGLTLFKELNGKIDRLEGYEKKTIYANRLITPEFYFQVADCRLNGLESLTDIEEVFLSMNEEETLDFLRDLLNRYAHPIKIDCRKALIFNLGNINSLYPMSNNYSMDLSANLFYEESLKVKINDVKDKLKSLFRHEQVARLGNNHIIYPSINKHQFEEFIKNELHGVSKQAETKLGFKLMFEESYLLFLYEVAIIPSLGYRPVLSTLDAEVKGQLGKLASVIIKQELDIDTATFNIQEDWVYVTFLKGKEEIFREPLKALPDRKAEKINDIDVIIATHETGHVLCGLILKGEVPSQIVTRSKDKNTLGFVYQSADRKLWHKEQIKFEIATLLGGRAAEELVFGGLRISSGSAKDIRSATELASKAIKEFGFGPVIGTVDNIEQSNLMVQNQDLERAIEYLLQEGYRIASATLRNHSKWLKEFSSKLLIKRNVDQHEILEMFDELGIDPKKYEDSYSYTWKFLKQKTQS